jgi:hypothetical protein
MRYSQFVNLLQFIALTSHNKYVLELSPDYIIEKFKRYINDDINTIDMDKDIGGIHPTVMEKIIDPYMEKWKIHINRKDFLADVLS